MPASITSSALPREELALAVVEGENAVDNLIGKQLLGDLPIDWRNAHIVKATLADTQGLRDISAAKYVHAPGTKFERLTATFGDASVTVTPRGVEIVVPREMTLDYRNRFDVMAFFSTRFGSQISALTKEKLIATAIFNTDATLGFGNATNSAVAYTAANGTYAAFVAGTGNSFIADIIASARRIKARGEVADTVAMSGTVFERIRQAFTVQAYVTGTLKAGQEATMEMIKNALAEYGIKNLLVGDSYVNTAADGATPSLTAIWNNTYIWVGKAGMQPRASETDGVGVPTIAGVGAMVFWQGYADGGTPSADRDAKTFAGGNYIETYPSLELDSEVIRLKMSQKPYILNNRAGDLIATQYS